MYTMTPGASPASGHTGSGHSDASSAKQSTGSTIPDALSVEEHGRLFNAYRQGKYFLPNDGEEQNRLDLQNHIWRLMLRGSLNLAPVPEKARVLDIGTGTGIWAIQYAREHPDATVVGTDISLIQPRDNLPSNCTFEREDAEETWMFDEPFDFIHWRLMFSCFKDHKSMIAKVYSHLAPGGWAEFHDWGSEYIGDTPETEELYQASSLCKWLQYFIAGGTALGRDFHAALKYKEYMIQAGFTDVVEKPILAPLNPWPLDSHDQMIGKWNSIDIIEIIGAVTKLLHAGGLPLEEMPAFVERVRYECVQPSMRVYCPVYVLYGRKPETGHHDTDPVETEPRIKSEPE